MSGVAMMTMPDGSNHLATAEQMIAHYNAQDADAYVALMTDGAIDVVFGECDR